MYMFIYFSVSNYIDWITPHLDSDLTEVKADESVEDFADDVAEDDKIDDAAAEPVKYNPKQVKRFCKLPADSENSDWADYTEINGSIKGKEKGDKVLRKLVTCLIQMQKVRHIPRVQAVGDQYFCDDINFFKKKR